MSSLRDPRHDVLFEPLQIGSKTLRNRFYGVAYGPGIGPYRPKGNAEHRRVQAEGGWAVVCTGVTSVSPEFGYTPFVDAAWGEEDEQTLALIVDAIHEGGALAGVELGHAGADSLNRDTRVPPLAPSQLPSRRRLMTTPKAMTTRDIVRVRRDYVRAALLAHKAGADILVVFGGFSYLPAQFLSPYFNKRGDRYGGSLENRARFWLEVLTDVRDAVGGDPVVSARVSAAGLSPVGIPLEETLEFVRMADDLVDLWDICLGAEWARDTASSRFFEENHEIEWSGRIREATKKPIVGVGRLTDPDLMAEIIRSGKWDLIGAARPRIADPFLPRKIEEGRYSEVRRCIGSNYCVHAYANAQIACVQNPTAGEEFRRGWHPRRLPALAADPGEILVVGAGPAGLEFAQTLAARGASRIRIVEAEAVPGGHLRWVSQLPRLADWWRIAEDRLRSIEQTDSVELLTDRRLDGPAVLDSGCSTVILATGSRWAPAPLDAVTHDEIPVPDRANVLTPDQLGRSGMPADWGSALVYDTYGDELAPAIAEWFAREGRTVHLLTPFPVVSPVADETMEGSLLRESLQSAGVRTLTGVTLSAVTGDGLRVSSEGGEREIAADGVVLISHRLSNLELSSDLEARRSDWREAGVERILSVGDCVAPRTLADAVFDGHRLAREFEEPDPEYAKAMRVEWRRSRGSAVEAG